jgi:hypothetical protein
MTTSGGFFHVDQRRPEGQRAGLTATQPVPTAIHVPRTVDRGEAGAAQPGPTASWLRRSRVSLGVVVCPMISGLFFGVIAAALVFRSGGTGRALGVGALTAGVMFTSSALALCIVMTASREAPSRPERSAEPVRASRAS